jgi:hypothetical protein
MAERREDKNKLLKNLWLVNRRLGGLDVCVSAVRANVNACICALLFSLHSLHTRRNTSNYFLQTSSLKIALISLSLYLFFSLSLSV